MRFMGVAPHAGAWIETCRSSRLMTTTCWSHPTRVRGLKLSPPRHRPSSGRVAPHAGAWIETRPATFPSQTADRSHPTRVRGLKPSSPRVRKASHSVAPHAGAWIETGWTRCRTCCACCRTPHGCVIEVGRLERSCKPACHDAPLRIHDLKLPAKTYPKAGLKQKSPHGVFRKGFFAFSWSW